MSKYVFLSHILKNDMPCYNGRNSIKIVQESSIEGGDSSNSVVVSLGNHVGTHIDFPRHFFQNGKTINDYSPDYFVFNKVSVWNIPLDAGNCIDEEMLKSCKCAYGPDLLIIRTGYGRFYGKEKYWNDNPGLSFAAARYIKETLPGLRALGLDFISINAYKNKQEGRKAHAELLSYPEIMIIEDMNLHDLTDNVKKVIVAPLLISDADGAPCNVIAEVEIGL